MERLSLSCAWQNKEIITISRTILFVSIAKFKEIVRYFEKIKGILREGGMINE